MTQLAVSLIDSEFSKFIEKLKEPNFKQIKLDDLFLEQKSEFKLINSLRELINKEHKFFKSIQSNEKIFPTFVDYLGQIYVDLSEVVIDHFDEKPDIYRLKAARESYERIMIFFTYLFHKFEILD